MPIVAQNARVTAKVAALPYSETTGLGGVIALDVPGQLLLEANIIADTAGFSGGRGTPTQNNNCNWAIPQNDWHYPSGSWRGGNKGFGIAKQILAKEAGRGAQTNGGGGGNDHNAGGGGGGNRTGGGDGGDNNEPQPLGCDGLSQGEGGYALNFGNANLFLGGGGGAGHGNNANHASGGNGGGLVMIRTNTIIGTNQRIGADGQDGQTIVLDGAGGGGAGGSIVLLIQNLGQSQLPTLTASGGKGGDMDAVQTNRCTGPGGGGAAGAIFTNAFGVPIPFVGGPGTILNSTNACNGSTSGAESGGNGSVIQITEVAENTTQLSVPVITQQPTPITTICAGQTAQLTVAGTGLAQFEWQVETMTGWLSLANSNNDTLNFGSTFAPGTYQITCAITGGTTCFAPAATDTVTVIILPVPVAAFTTMTTGTTVVFTNQSTNFSTCLWDFGDGSFSTMINTQHTFAQGVQEVILTLFSPCDTVQLIDTIVISLAPSAMFTHTDTLRGCAAMTLNLAPQNQQAGVNYRWLTPGGLPATALTLIHVPTYAQSGTYPITLIASNATGLSDTMTSQVVVVIQQQPISQFTFVALGTTGVVVFTNQSTGGTSYLWTFGDGTQMLTNATTVTHTYTTTGPYVVTLIASNDCGAAVTQIDINLTVIGTTEVIDSQWITLSPNPASASVRLTCAPEMVSGQPVQFVNMLGQVSLSGVLASDQQLFDVQHLTPGMYAVRVGELVRWLVVVR